MADGPGGDRTERATQRRRDEARNKGQVTRSDEVNAAFVLLAGVSLILAGAGHMTAVMGRNAAYLFGQAHLLRADNAGALVAIAGGNLRVMLEAMAPLLIGVCVAGVGANLMQIGFHVSTDALAFDPGRLNPVNGMKRFFGKRVGFDLLKNVLKIGLITLLAYGAIRGAAGDLAASPLLPLDGILHLGRVAFAKLLYRLLAFIAILALADWIFQKWQYEENLKMSRQEVKQEHKDLEGDPQIKARVRHIQFEASRRRMLADVPKADVIVTNPDHFAVALRYAPGEAAPRVVAKGKDRLAQTIKRIARESRVPVLENKPLARSLYRTVKLGAYIPESLYQAVAEVLAYVYRLKRA